MPLVYDFKDIASRMKGELKQEPTLEEILRPEEPEEHECLACNGTGRDNRVWASRCHFCKGTGVVS